MAKLSTLAAGAWFLIFATTACVDVEYGLELERDLSGTAVLDLDIDLERMAYVSARMQKMFSGQEGEPSEEELEAARQTILQEAEDEEEFSEEGLRGEIESDLPDGLELLELQLDEDGLQRHMMIRFGFDHVDRLSEVGLGPSEETQGSPETEPFGDLRVVDEGETILITNAALNPLAEVRGRAEGGMPGLERIIGQAFEGLRVAFSIRTPFEVVEHNATRQDGATLWWEYDFAALTGSGGETPQEIMVRYRK